MGKNLKRFLSMVLVATLCVCMTVVAYAACARYINEIETRCVLDISGGTATLYSEMGGDANIQGCDDPRSPEEKRKQL